MQPCFFYPDLLWVLTANCSGWLWSKLEGPPPFSISSPCCLPAHLWKRSELGCGGYITTVCSHTSSAASSSPNLFSLIATPPPHPLPFSDDWEHSNTQIRPCRNRAMGSSSGRICYRSDAGGNRCERLQQRLCQLVASYISLGSFMQMCTSP